MTSLSILYEDNHLLVVNKPAGIATMGVAADQLSLFAQAKQYLKQHYRKPGNVYLGVVSRLDLPVSGVVVFARTSKGAARLNEQFRRHEVIKIYVALVEPAPDPRSGTWIDWLRRDDATRKTLLHSHQVDGSQRAELRYSVRQGDGRRVLVQLEPVTGRRHQLRSQLAGRGCPIVGDRRYGSEASFPSGIALHAESIRIMHPTRRETMEFRAPLPPSWSDRWR